MSSARPRRGDLTRIAGGLPEPRPTDVHARQYRRGRSGERPGETRTHVLKIHQRG